MPWPTWSWVASKFLRTALPKALPNASRRWRWIAIWPTLMRYRSGQVFYGSRRRNRRPYLRSPPPLSSRYLCLPVDAYCVGVAKLQLGADAEAVAWLRRSIEANRNFPLAHFYLAAALALLGALDEARAAAKAGLALDPSFTIRRFRAARDRATIRLTLLDASASVRACAWPGCRRDDVGDWGQNRK